MEAIVADRSWQARPGEAVPLPKAALVVPLDHLRRCLSIRARSGGIGLAIDSARMGDGRRSHRSVFQSIGLAPIVIGDLRPDGRNINLPRQLRAPGAVGAGCRREELRAGRRFDGDGDQQSSSTSAGKVVDGDAVLLMCARQLQREGRLKVGAIVATMMSNLGLQVALEETGIGLVRGPGRRSGT